MDTLATSHQPHDAAGGGALRFNFHGTAMEYFGIWIVNLFLSIITLGIYTAWAKVRRLRYFYGSTELDGHNFEYHARPKQILIGRLIVVGLLVLYNVLVTFNPVFGLLLIPYLLGLPWILNRAMQFNARVTSYRNIRFNFSGDYGEAFVAFLIMPLLTLFSFGLLAPVASRFSSNYIGNHTRFGSAHFRTKVGFAALYKLLGLTFLFLILMGLGAAALGFAIGGIFDLTWLGEWMNTLDPQGGEDVAPDVMGSILGGIILGYAVFGLSYLFYRAGVRNIAFNATRMINEPDNGSEAQEFALHSDLSRLRYIWILLTNLVAILLSVGLLRAWAAIRTWRYLADHTALSGTSDLGLIVGGMADEGAAASAEYLDIEGIDFGL